MCFERPADFGAVQESALSDAISLLREHVADGLLDGETIVTRALAFEEPFDGLQAASLRRPFLDWTQKTDQRVLGPEHPDALVARSNFAAFIGDAGEPSAALQLFRALLPDIERVLGADHPYALSTRYDIASLTGDNGDPAAALVLFHTLLPDQEHVLGPDHLDTLSTRQRVAALTGSMGDPAAALSLLPDLLADMERVLGSEHSHVLSTLALMKHLETMMKGQTE